MLTQPKCLGCNELLPEAFLDLGNTPLANSLITPEQAHLPELCFHLAIAYCPFCYLVQLTHPVPPEAMFTHYSYFSSYSDTFLSHAREMAEFLSDHFNLNQEKQVLEIASNDGYLLQYFQQRGVRVLGVEPARNIAAHAQQRGITTLNRFFDLTAVQEIAGLIGKADVIIGNNVLAHVRSINEFLQAVKACLKPDGSAVFEFPYLKELLEKTEFDTIYHEHVFYFSLSAIAILAKRAGLELYDVSHQPIHGGSLRVFLQGNHTYPVSAAVGYLLAKEELEGLTREERYESFSGSVDKVKKDLLTLLHGLKSSGHKLAAYGAPAKGSTLLNYCGIGTDLIEFTVDRSPHKQGLLMPGSRLPIRPTEALLEEMPDYALILPWNFAEEIRFQQEAYRRKGGRFIVPIPHPAIDQTGHAEAEMYSLEAHS